MKGSSGYCLEQLQLAVACHGDQFDLDQVPPYHRFMARLDHAESIQAALRKARREWRSSAGATLDAAVVEARAAIEDSLNQNRGANDTSTYSLTTRIDDYVEEIDPWTGEIRHKTSFYLVADFGGASGPVTGTLSFPGGTLNMYATVLIEIGAAS